MQLFPKNIMLQNDKVLLRELQISDFEYLSNFSVNEPEIWQFGSQTCAGLQNLKTYIEIAHANKKGSEYPFIVFDKTKNEYAGSTRFYDINLINRSLQLGYTWYGNKFQGTKLNKNCKFLLLEFCFETLNLERVEFRADNNNVKSIAAMKSIGCIEEGVLRNHLPKLDSTERRNTIVLSILKNEWFETIKDNLKLRL